MDELVLAGVHDRDHSTLDATDAQAFRMRFGLGKRHGRVDQLVKFPGDKVVLQGIVECQDISNRQIVADQDIVSSATHQRIVIGECSLAGHPRSDCGTCQAKFTDVGTTTPDIRGDRDVSGPISGLNAIDDTGGPRQRRHCIIREVYLRDQDVSIANRKFISSDVVVVIPFLVHAIVENGDEMMRVGRMGCATR